MLRNWKFSTEAGARPLFGRLEPQAIAYLWNSGVGSGREDDDEGDDDALDSELMIYADESSK